MDVNHINAIMGQKMNQNVGKRGLCGVVFGVTPLHIGRMFAGLLCF